MNIIDFKIKQINHLKIKFLNVDLYFKKKINLDKIFMNNIFKPIYNILDYYINNPCKKINKNKIMI